MIIDAVAWAIPPAAANTTGHPGSLSLAAAVGMTWGFVERSMATPCHSP